MKVFVKLGLNTEYHGYDIFEGVYKSIKEIIEGSIDRFSPCYNVGYVTYTHKDYPEDSDEISQEFNVRHTHVMIYNKEYGFVSNSAFAKAVEDEEEMFLLDRGFGVLESVEIREYEI